MASPATIETVNGRKNGSVTVSPAGADRGETADADPGHDELTAAVLGPVTVERGRDGRSRGIDSQLSESEPVEDLRGQTGVVSFHLEASSAGRLQVGQRPLGQ